MRVLTASASFTDVMIRKVMYPDVKEKPPFSTEYDMVGVVDQVGPNASKFKIGQHIADIKTVGAYSEYMCLPEVTSYASSCRARDNSPKKDT